MTKPRRSMYEDAPDDETLVMDPAAKTQPAEGGRDEVDRSLEGTAPDEGEPGSDDDIDEAQ